LILREKAVKMEDRKKIISFEEVLDTEIDDIWDIFFPNISERAKKVPPLEQREQTKPRRYLNFLTM